MSAPELHSRNTSDEIRVIYLCTRGPTISNVRHGELGRIEVGVCKVKMREEISLGKNTLEDFQTQFVLYFNDNVFRNVINKEYVYLVYISVSNETLGLQFCTHSKQLVSICDLGI
jgi:hypothetical protein